MHPHLSSPCLYILGGLPGTGKSTLSQSLARHLRAVWLRIDTLEQSLRNQGLSVVADEGYQLAYALARDNLRLGLSVVADAVNPIAITRNAWRQVAQDGQCPYQELEIICSDAAIHRQRLLQRPDTVPGLARTPWQAVQTRTYEAWPTAYQLDTAHNTPAESLEQLLAHLQAFPIEAI
jgi:predicted kinase